MGTTFWIVVTAFAAMGAWGLAKRLEETRHVSRIKELESKFRFSQGETLNLREQMAALRGEVTLLQKDLERERAGKAAALNEMALSLKKGALVLTAVYFAVGISLGSVSSWFAATWRAESKTVQVNAMEKMSYELFKIKAELYEKRALENENALEILKKEIQEERIQKVIALTKMQILLESLSPKRGEDGFLLDYQRLKKNIKNEMKAEPVAVKMGVAEIPSRV